MPCSPTSRPRPTVPPAVHPQTPPPMPWFSELPAAPLSRRVSPPCCQFHSCSVVPPLVCAKCSFLPLSSFGASHRRELMMKRVQEQLWEHRLRFASPSLLRSHLYLLGWAFKHSLVCRSASVPLSSAQQAGANSASATRRSPPHLPRADPRSFSRSLARAALPPRHHTARSSHSPATHDGEAGRAALARSAASVRGPPRRTGHDAPGDARDVAGRGGARGSREGKGWEWPDRVERVGQRCFERWDRRARSYGRGRCERRGPCGRFAQAVDYLRCERRPPRHRPPVARRRHLLVALSLLSFLLRLLQQTTPLHLHLLRPPPLFPPPLDHDLLRRAPHRPRRPSDAEICLGRRPAPACADARFWGCSAARAAPVDAVGLDVRHSCHEGGERAPAADFAEPDAVAQAAAPHAGGLGVCGAVGRCSDRSPWTRARARAREEHFPRIGAHPRARRAGADHGRGRARAAAAAAAAEEEDVARGDEDALGRVYGRQGRRSPARDGEGARGGDRDGHG